MRSGIPVGKIARRLQIAPTAKTVRILARRTDAPGQHGARRAKAKSVYGEQLIEKQKLRFQYMITEKVLRRAYFVAQKKKGNSGENLIGFLDRRLDSTIFRSGIVNSNLAARQLITHGHVLVNGRKVDKPSFQTSDSDMIFLSEKAQKFPFIVEGLRDGNPVSYLTIDRDKAIITRTSTPTREQIPVDCKEQMVVEWYSR